MEWLGAAGGGGSVEHKGQEDVSRLLPTVSTHPTVVELKIENRKNKTKKISRNFIAVISQQSQIDSD